MVKASDVQLYKRECAELGFKIGSKKNADCALVLLKRGRNLGSKSNQPSEVEKAHMEAKLKELEYKEALMLQQQQQAYELQRRAVAAQEKAAEAQREAVDNEKSQYWSSTLTDMANRYYRQGPYAPAPRQSFTCTTFGQITNCR